MSKIKNPKDFLEKIDEQYNILKLLKEHRGHIYPTMGHTIYLLVHKQNKLTNLNKSN